MDEYDRAVADRIANLERELSARTREIRALIRDLATLLTALAVYEGGDVAEVSYRRLGRCQELTALWGDDPHPPTMKETG